MLHGKSGYSKTGSSLLSDVNGAYGRNDECGMGCYYNCQSYGVRGNGSVHQPKGGASCCGGLKKSTRCAF